MEISLESGVDVSWRIPGPPGSDKDLRPFRPLPPSPRRRRPNPRAGQHRNRIGSRDRSCAAGLGKPFDSECAQVFSIYAAASGVLQAVSPWSTSTLPILFAAAVAALRRAALRHPIAMRAWFMASRSALGTE